MTREKLHTILSEVAYDLDQTHGQVLSALNEAETALAVRDERLISEDAEMMLTLLVGRVRLASDQAELLAKTLGIDPAYGRGCSIVEQIRENFRAVRNQPKPLDLTGLPAEQQKPPEVTS
ncbi:MAG: hypothetical protein ABFD89_09195 [Bryobacteraceae bacterium]